LAKKNAVILNRKMKTVRLLIALCNDIPFDFIAANSYFSAKFPKTIKEVTNMVRGKTNGISLGETNHRNLRTIIRSSPLPASSDIYSQMV
jgi:hypothetical protein